MTYEERISEPPEPKCTRAHLPGCCFCAEQEAEEEALLKDAEREMGIDPSLEDVGDK